MSIWTRPIFGRSPPRTPAREVQVRCARIRWADGAARNQIMIGAHFLGFGLWTAVFLAAAAVVTMSSDFGVGESILAVLDGVDPGTIAAGVGVAVLITWGQGRVARRAIDRTAGHLTREQLAWERRLRRHVPRIWAGMAMAVGAGLVLFGALLSWSFALLAAAMFVTNAGCVVAGLELFGRRGARLVCGRCDYPMVTWRGAPARCPECGHGWKQPWGARFGRRAVRRRRVWLGLVLLAVAAELVVLFGVIESAKG